MFEVQTPKTYRTAAVSGPLTSTPRTATTEFTDKKMANILAYVKSNANILQTVLQDVNAIKKLTTTIQRATSTDIHIPMVVAFEVS